MFSYGSATVDGVALVGNRAKRYAVTAKWDDSAHDGFAFDGIGIESASEYTTSEYTKILRLHLWSANIATPSNGIRVTVSPAIESYPTDLDLPIAVAVARLCGARFKERLTDFRNGLDAFFCGNLVCISGSYGRVMHSWDGNVARVLAANGKPLVTHCASDEFMPYMCGSTLIHCEKLDDIIEEANESAFDHAVRHAFRHFGNIVIDNSDNADRFIVDMIESAVLRVTSSMMPVSSNKATYAKAISAAGGSDMAAAKMYRDGTRPSYATSLEYFQKGDLLNNLMLCAGGTITLFDADEASDELLRIVSKNASERQYDPLPWVVVLVCDTHDGAECIAEKLGVQPMRSEDIYKMHCE